MITIRLTTQSIVVAIDWQIQNLAQNQPTEIRPSIRGDTAGEGVGLVTRVLDRRKGTKTVQKAKQQQKKSVALKMLNASLCSSRLFASSFCCLHLNDSNAALHEFLLTTTASTCQDGCVNGSGASTCWSRAAILVRARSFTVARVEHEIRLPANFRYAKPLRFSSFRCCRCHRPRSSSRSTCALCSLSLSLSLAHS
jgi:hypothetical protein